MTLLLRPTEVYLKTRLVFFLRRKISLRVCEPSDQDDDDKNQDTDECAVHMYID